MRVEEKSINRQKLLPELNNRHGLFSHWESPEFKISRYFDFDIHRIIRILTAIPNQLINDTSLSRLHYCILKIKDLNRILQNFINIKEFARVLLWLFGVCDNKKRVPSSLSQ